MKKHLIGTLNKNPTDELLRCFIDRVSFNQLAFLLARALRSEQLLLRFYIFGLRFKIWSRFGPLETKVMGTINMFSKASTYALQSSGNAS